MRPKLVSVGHSSPIRQAQVQIPGSGMKASSKPEAIYPGSFTRLEARLLLARRLH